METQVRRYQSHNAAGTSSRSSPSYSPGPSTSYHRGNMMPQPRAVPDLHGRARKKAELNRLNQEIRILQVPTLISFFADMFSLFSTLAPRFIM